MATAFAIPVRPANVANLTVEAAALSITPRISVSLLGGFELTHDGRRVATSGGGQRLVAFLALRGKTISRSLVAATLWPDVTEAKALANLRAALTRLDASSRLALQVTQADLALAPGVNVDLHEAQAVARRILDPGGADREAAHLDAPVSLLSAELLPGWYDDWALFAIEDWHQLRLHALELLASALCRVGRLAEGMAAARAAVRADPLKESARAALIAAYIASADRAAAIREFADYEATVRQELGIGPSAGLRAVFDRLIDDSTNQ